MHILHGTWLVERQQFAIWGENTGIEAHYTRGRRAELAWHPFAMNYVVLEIYLQRFLTLFGYHPETLTLWLPGVGKRAQPSPQAVSSGMEALEGNLTLLGWQANCALLSATDAIDFLLQATGEHDRNLILGSDLRFWQQAALLSVNCLVEGRYIPALSKQGTQFKAHWEAMPDMNLVRQMSESMPSSCRIVIEDIEEAPNASYLLNKFLSSTIDAFIREHYQGQKEPKTAWLQALTAKDDTVRGVLARNLQLYEAWEKWRSVGDVQGGNTFRICFRLNEPRNDTDLWRLDYLLQANDDPSLLVESKHVWLAGQGHLDYLEHRFHRPQEKLLAGLGLASRMFKPIEDSLRQAHPTHVYLTREDAYEFLTEALPLLEASGFSVLVPNWWGRRARLKAKARLRGQTNEPSGMLTRDSILHYEWRMSLGDEALSREEFEALVALKQPLVRYKGEWITLDPEQIEAAKTFFEQTKEGDMTLEDALKASMQDTNIDMIEVEGVDVEGWLEDVFARLYEPEKIPLPPTPKQLEATLRPYQMRGFAWLAQMRQLGFGACLADDMGLGKTLQSITLWLHEREALGVTSPALLVCPTSVVGNWRHEIRRFAPSLRVMVHHGSERLQEGAFLEAVEKVDVVLTSYALLRRDVALFQEVAWSDMVLDEAQNIKNATTKQAQAARQIGADFKLALTGTPVENRLTELWSIFQFINPSYLGSQKAFKLNFATPIERYGDEQASKALRQLTAPFILRRLKTDTSIIQDLPDKFENKVYCTMTPEQVTLYEASVREAMEAIESADEDMARRGNILRMLTQLKQICNHPSHFMKEGGGASLLERSGKLDRLTEMVEEIRDNDERLLIFTQYKEMGDILQGHLREYFVDEVLFLHGGTPSKQRDEMVRRFQSPHGPAIFILSLKTGGTGLTLTSANHVFHFDRWYNPAVENQATDRAFRIGQTRDVQVHKFICLGTLEERIDEMIEKKQAIADAVIGGGESWISELNNEALRELVTLRRDVLEV